MAQAALGELTLRRENGQIRAGESMSSIRWVDVADMGGVIAQKLPLSQMEFLALDYGDRLRLPVKLSHQLGEWGNTVNNQCSIAHLDAGVEWHLQNRPIRFHLKALVQNLASEFRILEYNRA